MRFGVEILMGMEFKIQDLGLKSILGFGDGKFGARLFGKGLTISRSRNWVVEVLSTISRKTYHSFTISTGRCK